jgi:hypothetical protein
VTKGNTGHLFIGPSALDTKRKSSTGVDSSRQIVSDFEEEEENWVNINDINSQGAFEYLLRIQKPDGSFPQNHCSLYLLGNYSGYEITRFSGKQGLSEEVVFHLFMLKKWKANQGKKFIQEGLAKLENWFQGKRLNGKSPQEYLQIMETCSC